MTRDGRNDIGVLAAAILAGAWMLGCVPGITAPIVDRSHAVTDARKTLFLAIEDEDGITRAHAIEALDYTIGIEAGEHFLAGLSDPFATVRFASAMAIGETGYLQAKDKLSAMAAGEEENKNVLCGVIYALYRLGDDSHMNRLAKLLVDPNPWVRANAAFIMGKAGQPSAVWAVQLLKDLVNDERNIDVLVRARESLAMLGDVASAMRLEGDTLGPFVDDSIDAIRALSRLGGLRAQQQLEYLVISRTDLSPLVRVAAAGGLGRMGVFNQVGYDLCVRSATRPISVLGESADSQRTPGEADIRALQQLSAISLGWIGRSGAVDHLHPLLGHRDGRIRVAAAMSILQLLLPNYDQDPVDVTTTEPELP